MKLKKNCWIFRLMAKLHLENQKRKPYRNNYDVVGNVIFLTCTGAMLIYLYGLVSWLALHQSVSKNYFPTLAQVIPYGIVTVLATIILAIILMYTIAIFFEYIIIPTVKWCYRNYHYSLLYEKHNQKNT